MTMARQHARGGNAQPTGFAAGRGLLLVLFAVAIGVLLLAKALDGDSAADGAGATPKTTTSVEPGAKDDATTVPPAQTTAPPPTIPPAHPAGEVLVLVANGRAVQGAAAANQEALLAKGFNALAPTDHPATQVTGVYFADVNWQADAVAVAQSLNVTNTPEAFPAGGFPIDIKEAKVVVILGADGQGLKPS
jgi:hypothetical protein